MQNKIMFCANYANVPYSVYGTKSRLLQLIVE
jgi:hypothetical protein